ncbi:MAG: heparinase II/III-family protein, partial [Chitinophagaceae bacterium]|nr:heparinase II/III-family protein [Chitinophagaceae bacterium]
ALRQAQRGTMAHNTVCVNNADQFEVWGSFRVGRRAHLQILEEGKDHIAAMHNGYLQRFGVKHVRKLTCQPNGFLLTDELTRKRGPVAAQAMFHFDHSLQISHNAGEPFLRVADTLMRFEGHEKIDIIVYDQALAFNKLVKSSAVRVAFKDHLRTTIELI